MASSHGSPWRLLAAAVIALAVGSSPTIAADCAPTGVVGQPTRAAVALDVDLTDTVHKLLRVHESIPVVPGPLTLAYPQWIPGWHSPAGRVNDLAGLVLNARGKRLDWQRDAGDPFLFHATVPPKTERLDLEFQYLGGLEPASGSAISSPQMVRVNWHTVVLYPLTRNALAIPVSPSIRAPQHWQTVTALDVAGECNGELRFQVSSLETLVDSPLVSGAHLRRYELYRESGKPVFLDVIGESDADTAVSDEALAKHRQAFSTVARYFGVQPYAHYDFIVPFSTRLSGSGVEHLQSTEASMPLKYFSDANTLLASANMLVHEYVHTWNGKWHRPAGLATPNYNERMRGDLLWVYEGLTSYLDKVLTVRGGLWSASLGRDVFAGVVANFDHWAGRSWRSLQDTTTEPVTGQSDAWESWARGEDYYEESALLWLEVDARIRTLSHGRRSLDDFIRAFFGSGAGSQPVHRYTFMDLVGGLNAVQRFDWASLLRARLDAHDPETFKEGTRLGGYRLAYSSDPSQWTRIREARDKMLRLEYSLGAVVDAEGKVSSVLWDSPAFKAGLLPADKILQVGGKAYTKDTLRDAVAGTAAAGVSGLAIKVDGPDGPRDLNIVYHGGLRYPHLERISGSGAILDEILASH